MHHLRLSPKAFWINCRAKHRFARHPEAVFFTAEMGAPEIEAFLTHLVQAENVAASTQNQAFNALLFLYRNALHVELNVPIHALCVKRAEHLPTVLLKA